MLVTGGRSSHSRDTARVLIWPWAVFFVFAPDIPSLLAANREVFIQNFEQLLPQCFVGIFGRPFTKMRFCSLFC
jgi:hypothetical protein